MRYLLVPVWVAGWVYECARERWAAGRASRFYYDLRSES